MNVLTVSYSDKLSLKKQSLNGALWTFIDILVNKGSYFIATIILARILGPREFGIIGMITIFVTIGNVLVDSGMSTSLLRSNKITETDYSTVFIINIVTSFIVYCLLFFTAPFIANFYKQLILIDVIRIYGLGILINSFRSIHNVKLTKDLEFKKLTILNLPGNIIGLIVAVWIGYLGFGVWSLVYLFIVNQFISTSVFWFAIKWKPSMEFDYLKFKHHFKFGYKLLLSAQLNVIFENIYNVLIGKFYNIKVLGFYERAYAFNSYPVSILSSIITKVSLPSLTLINDDTERLQNAYKNILQIAFYITATGLCFGVLLANQFVSIVLGDNWLQVVPFFQILALSFIFYPLHSLNINILSIFGRSDLFLKLEIIKKITFSIIIIISFNFGIIGLVWSSVINSIIGLIINTYYSGKFLNYPTIKQLRDLFPTLAVVLASMFVIYIFLLNNNSNHLIQIISSFGLGFLGLIIFSELIKLSPYIYLKHLTKEFINK
jgi:O-antigen/teichoic acid export membrane protein